MSDQLPDHWWRDAEILAREVRAAGGFRGAQRATGVHHTTLSMWWGNHGLPAGEFAGGGPIRVEDRIPPEVRISPETGIDLEELRRALRRYRKGVSVQDLADELDTSPRRVRRGLEELREAGYRIGERGVDEIILERGTPDQTRVFPNLLPSSTGLSSATASSPTRTSARPKRRSPSSTRRTTSSSRKASPMSSTRGTG